VIRREGWDGQLHLLYLVGEDDSPPTLIGEFEDLDTAILAAGSRSCVAKSIYTRLTILGCGGQQSAKGKALAEIKAREEAFQSRLADRLALTTEEVLADADKAMRDLF
jgi:hypothetical protein